MAATMELPSRTRKFDGRLPLSISAIILGTMMVQMTTGVNAVLLPYTLEMRHFNNTLIGVCMSVEIVAVLCISRFMTTIISRLGMTSAIYISTLFRVTALFTLMTYTNYYVWVLAVFVTGLAGNVLLISLQTWLNTIQLAHFKGLVIGAYSASLSLGYALGPVVLHFTGVTGTLPFKANCIVSAVTVLPFVFLKFLIPKIRSTDKPRIGFVLRLSPAVFYSALVGGVTFFGLPAFLTLFALKNAMPVNQASLLITAFMLGSIILGMVISLLSDFIDRRYIIIICVFMGLLCAGYLGIAIYSYVSSLILLFVWGGMQGGIYATGLTIVGERYRMEDQVSANVAYTLMDAVGGVLGVLLIGVGMDAFGSEGMAYVIVSAAVIYFIFALSRYRVD